MDNRLKILVADDEERILSIFQSYFRSKNNFTILTATDGIEAFEIVKREEIDCCITDLSMPSLDGLELIRRIHTYNNTIPVVVITGYPSVDAALKTLRNGVVDFLIKPFGMHEILSTIERVMRKRTQFIENILKKEERNRNEQLLKVNQELQQKRKEVKTLDLILHKISQETTSRGLFTALVNISGDITTCDEAHLCIFDQEVKEPRTIASFFRDKERVKGAAACVQSEVIRKIADERIPLFINEHGAGVSILAVPLKVKSRVFGVLISLNRDDTHRFCNEELYLLNLLGKKASVLVENMALYENISENLFSILYALVETIEARDPYTKQHSARVAHYAVPIAETIGCSQEDREKLAIACNLHDIGKIGVPDKILLKPGRLTDEEYEVIKKHPVIGANIINHFNMWSSEQEIIRHHHERWDGHGYPDGLGWEKIPLLSRILAVADVYDSLTSDRSYRRRLTESVSLREIKENGGSQFDSEIVDVFLDLYDKGMIIS